MADTSYRIRTSLGTVGSAGTTVSSTVTVGTVIKARQGGAGLNTFFSQDTENFKAFYGKAGVGYESVREAALPLSGVNVAVVRALPETFGYGFIRLTNKGLHAVDDTYVVISSFVGASKSDMSFLQKIDSEDNNKGLGFVMGLHAEINVRGKGSVFFVHKETNDVQELETEVDYNVEGDGKTWFTLADATLVALDKDSAGGYTYSNVHNDYDVYLQYSGAMKDGSYVLVNKVLGAERKMEFSLVDNEGYFNLSYKEGTKNIFTKLVSFGENDVDSYGVSTYILDVLSGNEFVALLGNEAVAKSSVATEITAGTFTRNDYVSTVDYSTGILVGDVTTGDVARGYKTMTQLAFNFIDIIFDATGELVTTGGNSLVLNSVITGDLLGGKYTKDADIILSVPRSVTIANIVHKTVTAPLSQSSVSVYFSWGYVTSNDTSEPLLTNQLGDIALGRALIHLQRGGAAAQSYVGDGFVGGILPSGSTNKMYHDDLAISAKVEEAFDKGRINLVAYRSPSGVMVLSHRSLVSSVNLLTFIERRTILNKIVRHAENEVLPSFIDLPNSSVNRTSVNDGLANFLSHYKTRGWIYDYRVDTSDKINTLADQNANKFNVEVKVQFVAQMGYISFSLLGVSLVTDLDNI